MLATLQPKAIFLQQLQVIGRHTTIGCMTAETEHRLFSARLNEICDEIGVPPKGKARQKDVAKRFGVSQNAARKWLEGEGFPKIETGLEMARMANVQFDWLMTGRPPKRLHELFADHPLLARYERSDQATRALIDVALADPESPLPEDMPPSLRALVDSVRQLIAEQMRKP